jgi:hypothetical protein
MGIFLCAVATRRAAGFGTNIFILWVVLVATKAGTLEHTGISALRM